MTDNRTRMIEKNFEAFCKLLPLLKQVAGKYALMRDCELIETFSGAEDAHKYARVKYDDDNYSVHEIRFTPVVVTRHSAGFGYPPAVRG